MANVYNNPDFIRLKNFLLTVYGDNCPICGVVAQKLEVHHVDKDNTNNSLDNLIPVCVPCHKLLHKSDLLKLDINELHKRELMLFIKEFIR